MIYILVRKYIEYICTMYIVQCTVYIIHCISYIIHRSTYDIKK